MAFTVTRFSAGHEASGTQITLAGPFSIETQVIVKNLGPEIVWLGTESGNVLPYSGDGVAVEPGQSSAAILMPSSTTLYAITSGGPAHLSYYYTQ